LPDNAKLYRFDAFGSVDDKNVPRIDSRGQNSPEFVLKGKRATTRGAERRLQVIRPEPNLCPRPELRVEYALDERRFAGTRVSE